MRCVGKKRRKETKNGGGKEEKRGKRRRIKTRERKRETLEIRK